MRGPLGHGRYLRPATIGLSEKREDRSLCLVMADGVEKLADGIGWG